MLLSVNCVNCLRFRESLLNSNLYTLDWDNIETISTDFTPSKNGIVITCAGGASGTYVLIKDYNTGLNMAISWTPTTGNVAVNAIVTKGRRITIETNRTNTINCKFVPFK